MASIPITQPSRPSSVESAEARFLRLAELWHNETAHQSSSAVRYGHPAYREIIAMGKEVVPLLLHDLERNNRRWFAALQEITGARARISSGRGQTAANDGGLASVGTREWVDCVTDFEALFPKLRGSNYRITSPTNSAYNCVAWAAADANRWWWPDAAHEFWPADIPRVETLPAFQEAFASLGYMVCAGEEVESGSENVALFADRNGAPRHAARQLPTGLWTSKLGELEDIEHSLRDLEGAEYGSVAVIMKRPFPRAAG